MGGSMATGGGMGGSMATGNHLWSKRFGGTSFDFGTSVAVDSAGNVLVTGEFNGTADFGGGGLTSAGNTDIFVAKYDAAGNHLWSKRFGGTNYDYGYSVAVDSAGKVLVTGYFSGTADFGGGGLTSAGQFDIFVAKYDAAANHLWSKRFGEAGSDAGNSVAVDSGGNVLVTGSFEDTVDFGGGGLTSAGFADIFVAKFSP